MNAQPTTEPNRTAVGVTVFAAVLLIMTGVFQAIQGLVALVNDTFYVAGEEYVFTLDLTAWGWIHLLLGVLVAVAGYFLLQGKLWARTVGIVVAVASALFNFAWLPQYPLWGLVIITLDVFVIWALTVHGRDVTKV